IARQSVGDLRFTQGGTRGARLPWADLGRTFSPFSIELRWESSGGMRVVADSGREDWLKGGYVWRGWDGWDWQVANGEFRMKRVRLLMLGGYETWRMGRSVLF